VQCVLVNFSEVILLALVERCQGYGERMNQAVQVYIVNCRYSVM